MDDIFLKVPRNQNNAFHALFIGEWTRGGESPREVIHDYVVNKAKPDSLHLEKVNKYLLPSLETLDLFSQSLRSKQTDQYWWAWIPLSCYLQITKPFRSTSVWFTRSHF